MRYTQKIVLIVDDSEDELFFAKQVLDELGYEVLSHRSPFGLTGLIEAARPDLVLLGTNQRAFPGEDLAASSRADTRTRYVSLVLHAPGDTAVIRSNVIKYRLSGLICKQNASELRMKVPYFLNEHIEDPAAFRRRLYAVE